MQRLQRQWALSDSALCSILISNLGRFIIVRYSQSPSIIVINVTNRPQCSIYFFVPHLFIGHNIWGFGIFSGRNCTLALFLGHKVYFISCSLVIMHQYPCRNYCFGAPQGSPMLVIWTHNLHQPTGRELIKVQALYLNLLFTVLWCLCCTRAPTRNWFSQITWSL